MSTETHEEHIDPATVEGPLGGFKLLSPTELYWLWERQQWSVGELDLASDRDDWERLDDVSREELTWNLAQFFVGEERVTTAFSPIVLAAESEEEEAYLTTQQVDEARHAKLFSRFWEEVLADDATTLDERMAGVRTHCNASFTHLFDDVLMTAVDRLRVEPADIAAKVRAIVTYHMIVEGTLALTGQYFTTEYLTDKAILPGFLEGFGNVARDEHRHVGYGTWFLQQKCREPRHADLARDTLLELIPIAASVLVPPKYEGQAAYEVLGFSSQDIQQFALTALTRRLKVIGLPIPGLT
jgi:ribonucleoside-diphosphate reductase beta chain